jgi:hypothetical protein
MRFKRISDAGTGFAGGGGGDGGAESARMAGSNGPGIGCLGGSVRPGAAEIEGGIVCSDCHQGGESDDSVV